MEYYNYVMSSQLHIYLEYNNNNNNINLLKSHIYIY